MDLLEREDLLVQLDTVLNEVASGKGRLVFISGEAGIGKTSLVESFVANLEKRARVLWGACDALFTPRPLGPLYDIAHQTHGKLLEQLNEEAPRNLIFSSVLAELEKQPPITLAVIEDAHWADEATLDLLKFLGRRVARINALLVVTYRDDEVGADHPLKLVLGDMPPRSVARIRLSPLSQAAVNKLADQAARPVEDIYAITRGNPFFVSEVLAHPETNVPVTVSDAVLSGAARLSHEAREVLEFVSVIPAKAELWLVNDTIGPNATGLEECVTTGILRDDGDAIAFRHELARRAIEDSVAATRRRALHELVLKSLLRQNSETLLARIVHHAAQAGAAAVALEHAPVAAKQAAALGAHREAASHYQTALRFADACTPAQKAHLIESRSYECYLTGQLEEALNERAAALRISLNLGDQLRRGDNLRWMSRLAWSLGRREDAEHYCNEAVTVLESLPAGPELAMAYSNRAQLHMLAQEHGDAVRWGQRAIELAEKLGATETLVHALNNVGSAELFAYQDEGRLKLEERLRLALANGLQDHVGRAYSNIAFITVKNRQCDLAGPYLREGIAYATEHDLCYYELCMVASRSQFHFDQGNWDSAADDAAFVLGHYRVAATTKMVALTVLGHLRLRRGDPGSSPLLAEAKELAMQTRELQRIAPVASALAEFAWLNGDREQVQAEAETVLELAKGHHDPWIQEEFAYWGWRAGELQEKPKSILTPYSLQMMGEWRAAAASWNRLGCPYEAATALADGDERAQREALVIFERLEARPASEKVRQKLRATGARGVPRGPHRSTKENAAGLTSRQAEVLILMVEGLSNSEIANRMFISTRTVDHHVAAIFDKLEVHTRAEAVSVALQTRLLPN